MKQKKDGIRYFWDTCAIVELENGNPKYSRFLNEPIILTIFNMAEIFWVMLNQFGEEKAEEIYETYKPAMVEIDDETLMEAIKFRKKVYNTKKISYTDAIGYIYALKNDMIFLTGDGDFEDIKNVEFIKK